MVFPVHGEAVGVCLEVCDLNPDGNEGWPREFDVVGDAAGRQDGDGGAPVGLDARRFAPENLLRDVAVEPAVDDGLDAVRGEALAVCFVGVVLVYDGRVDAFDVLQNLAPDGVCVDAACIVHGLVIPVPVFLIRLAGPASVEGCRVRDRRYSLRDAGVDDDGDGARCYVALWARCGGLCGQKDGSPCSYLPLRHDNELEARYGSCEPPYGDNGSWRTRDLEVAARLLL